MQTQDDYTSKCFYYVEALQKRLGSVVQQTTHVVLDWEWKNLIRINANIPVSLCDWLGKKSTIEEMKIMAHKKWGKCLSEKYVNNNTKLKWQCEKGHVWDSIPHGIKKGQWCPVCGGTLKLTIEDCTHNNIIKNYRGKISIHKRETPIFFFKNISSETEATEALTRF